MRMVISGVFFAICFVLAPMVSADQFSDNGVLVSPPNNSKPDQGQVNSTGQATVDNNALIQPDPGTPDNHEKKGGHRHRKHDSDNPLSADNSPNNGQ